MFDLAIFSSNGNHFFFDFTFFSLLPIHVLYNVFLSVVNFRIHEYLCRRRKTRKNSDNDFTLFGYKNFDHDIRNLANNLDKTRRSSVNSNS